MIDFDYDSWKSSVFGILKSFYKSPYIQLFPFSQLTREDKKFIESKDFFYKWIKTGAFTYHFDTWNICNSYILKNDGTYRKATNISPIFFLFISAFTKHISTFYTQSYENREIKTFYAGEITKNRFNYKKDYNNYCKEINNNSQSYTHFIKLDINNFFTNININTLFDLINLKLNNGKINIRTRDLLFYKELLKCLGNGTFPIIRNSTALSFLATKIYLEDFDINLYDFIDRLYISFVNNQYVF
ncbi:hypothetical protein IJD44_11235 [bacterium]|nr:hypothetical protein [bacterium]